MRIKALIQALTETAHIVCESIETDASTGAINIIAHPDRKSQYRCGICGKNLLAMTTAAEHVSGAALIQAKPEHMSSPKLRVYASRNTA